MNPDNDVSEKAINDNDDDNNNKVPEPTLDKDIDIKETVMDENQVGDNNESTAQDIVSNAANKSTAMRLTQIIKPRDKPIKTMGALADLQGT